LSKRNNQPGKGGEGEDNKLRNRNKKIIAAGIKKRAIKTKVEEEINEVKEVVNEVEEGDGMRKTEKIKIEANAVAKEAREVRVKEVVDLDMEVEEDSEGIGILIEEMMEDSIEMEVALVIGEIKDRITEVVEGISAIKMEDTEEMARMDEVVTEVKVVGEGTVKVEVKVEAMEEVMEGEETTTIIEMTETAEIITNKANKIARQPNQSL
jgi:hypothetical protein